MNAVYTILAALLLLAGCGGNGPSGPEADAGVYSETFMFSMTDAQINGPVASVQYDVPAITPAVTDFGAVLLYFREQGTWTALPYTFAEESLDLPAVDYTITLAFGFEEGFLEVFYEASTSQVDLAGQPNRQLRMVVIEDLSVGKAGVDLSDYEAVSAYYGLDE